MSVIQMCSFSHSKTRCKFVYAWMSLMVLCHQKCMVCKEEGCDAAGTLERSWLQRCDILSMLYVLAPIAEYLSTGGISDQISILWISLLFEQTSVWPKPVNLKDTLVSYALH